MFSKSQHDWSAKAGRHPRRSWRRILRAAAVLPAFVLGSSLFVSAAPSSGSASEQDGAVAVASHAAMDGRDSLPSDLRPEWIGLPELPEPQAAPEAPPLSAESPRESFGQALAALHQDSVALAAPAAVTAALDLPLAPNRLDAGAIGSGASFGPARGAERGGWGSSAGFGGGGIRLPARGGECATPGPFGRGSLR